MERRERHTGNSESAQAMGEKAGEVNLVPLGSRNSSEDGCPLSCGDCGEYIYSLEQIGAMVAKWDTRCRGKLFLSIVCVPCSLRRDSGGQARALCDVGTLDIFCDGEEEVRLFEGH